MPDSREPATRTSVVLAGVAGLGTDVVRRILEASGDLDVVLEREIAALPRLVRTRPVDVIVIAGDGRAAWDGRAIALATGDVPLIVVYVDGHLEIHERRVLREAAPEHLLDEIRRVTAPRAVTMARPQHERVT